MKEDAEILLKKAENDLKDAKILFKSNEASMEGICFHCQQAVLTLTPHTNQSLENGASLPLIAAKFYYL